MVVVVVGTEPVTDTLHPFAVIGRIFTAFVSNRLSTLSPMEVVVLAIAATLKVIFATLTTPFGDVTFMTWKAAMFVAPGVGVFVVGLPENSAVSPPSTAAIVRTAGS